MKVLYRIDADGKGQVINDVLDTSKLVKRPAKRLGYVVTEFLMYANGEEIEVVALTPDTMMAAERLEIERLIKTKHHILKQINRILL